jgi:cytoskeletal protein CcmA (bactofilin family)
VKRNLELEAERPRGTPDCVIGRGVAVEGRLACGGFLRVEGRCSGSLESEGDIVVAEGAEVQADIKGRNVVVAGTAAGSIEAGDAVHLTSAARVKSSVVAKRFSMDEGAVFSGKVGRPAE